MDRLLIIADDFTGALDTGIQFCKEGVRAKVVTEFHYDFASLDPNVSVLVINTDSRPLTPAAAYERVYAVAKDAIEAGFRYIYKKTDSGLRGNIGPEIKAVLDAAEEKVLHFIPALPRLNRITKGGEALIDGIPVNESVFGRDPFEPVMYSDIEQIIHSKADVKVVKVADVAEESPELNVEENTICLYDAASEEDFAKIAAFLKEKNNFFLCSGCAGFASSYFSLLEFDKSCQAEKIETEGLLALCGSVNQITIDQLDYARKHGFKRGNLTCDQKLDGEYFDTEEGRAFLGKVFETASANDRYILDTLDTPYTETVEEYVIRKDLTADQCRFQISDNLGRIAMEMIERDLNRTFSLTGGDTLMGLMRGTGCKELMPVCEIGKGAVLSILEWKGKKIQVISKSGGFGEPEIFNLMYKTIME